MTALANRQREDPLVSMVMTTYNGSRYVRETVESVLGQTLGDLEFIIVDDKSDDNTVEILESYEDPRIRLVCNDTNRGISESRNRALRMARGEIVATTDQDDVSEPDRLEQEVGFLLSNLSVDVLGSRVYFLEGGRRREDPMLVQAHPKQVHLALFFGRHNLTYSTLCVRLRFLKENQLYFRQEFHYAEDFELYHRMAQRGDLAVLPKPLVGYRIHGENNSLSGYDEMTANGARFLGEAYSQLLGRRVDVEEASLIWSVIVEHKMPKDYKELQRVGEIMRETTEAFGSRYCRDRDERELVSRTASGVWWAIVSAAARKFGFSAKRVWDEFPGLQGGIRPAEEWVEFYVRMGFGALLGALS